MSSSSLFLVVGLLATLGCANVSTYEPVSLPGWAVPSPSKSRPQVRLPDVAAPDPSTTPHVTLDQLLVYADIHAPALRVARAESGFGDAELEAASVIFQNNPELGLELVRRRVVSRSGTEAEVSLQQRIEIAGERGLRMETASRAREVALATLEEERWSIHVETHALFFELLIARRRVAAAENTLSFAKDLDHVASRRIESGQESPLTRFVAQAELAHARERLIEVEDEEGAVVLLLKETVGWPMDRTLVGSGVLPPVRSTKGIEVLVRLAAEHHPSFSVRALAVAHAESYARLQAREAWPEPTALLAYSREGEAGEDADIWRVSLGIPLPLWNRNDGERARAKAQLQTVRAKRDGLHMRWRGELERSTQHVNKLKC